MAKKFIFRKGLKYVCTFSASLGYKEGGVYECYLNSKGDMCLRGSDGIEDLTKNIVSTFKEQTKVSYLK